MRGARLGGAGAVLVGRDQARDDRLERVGFGGGQRFQRLEPRRCERRRRQGSRRFRCGGSRGWFCGGRGLRVGSYDSRCGAGHRGSGAGESDLLEQMAARDIAGRAAPVGVIGHDVLPGIFLNGLMVHPTHLRCKTALAHSAPSSVTLGRKTSVALALTGNPLPHLKIFLQKRLPQKGYPLSGANRFWTGFWERGHEQFSESKSPPYRGVASAARTSKLV